MRVVTYNVHSCIGTDGRHSPERIADVLAAVQPDVACLQELDLERARTLRSDQARVIAKRLGMSFQFHPTISRETEHYGDAILSKHPLTQIRAATFPAVPKPFPREQRGAIWISVRYRDETWQIINTHFGLGREERRLQAKYLAKDWIEKALPGPLIVCGDLNSRPGSMVHRILGAQLTDVHHVARQPRGRTFSTAWPLICLDYVFVTPGIKVGKIEVVRTPLSRIASDHFPLVVELEK